MAIADVARGWGVLPSSLRQWHCPKCEAESNISDWKKVIQIVNQISTDSRQCPKCNYLAWSCGDTAMMAKQMEKNEMRKLEALSDDPKEKSEEVAAEPVAEEQIAGAAAEEDKDINAEKQDEEVADEKEVEAPEAEKDEDEESEK